MNFLASLCRYTATRRPSVVCSMPGFFFRDISPAVCRPPGLAPVAEHLLYYHTTPRYLPAFRPIQRLYFQHINRAICHPPALRQVLLPTRHYCTPQHRPVTPKWYYDPRKVLLSTIPLIGIGGAVIANYGFLETVPYTNRSHFVFRSPLEEREHGESRIAYLKEKYAAAILDQRHPRTVRVNRIATKLIHAVYRDLATKSHDTVTLHGDNVGSSAMEVFSRTLWNKERRKRPQMRHLDGLNWEVIVIKDSHVDMWSLPAGKIIVPTGLLKFYKTDAELASVIAHEIGHIVARHWAEKIIYKWLPSPLKLHFCQRTEIEADLIGMMLLGLAGFDPRIAPLTVEKLGDSNRGFLNSHPSSKKRSQLLSETKIMEEALKLYREVNPHQNTERSLKVKS